MESPKYSAINLYYLKNIVLEVIDEEVPSVEKLPPKVVSETFCGRAQLLGLFALTAAYFLQTRIVPDKYDFAPTHPKGQTKTNKWSHLEC